MIGIQLLLISILLYFAFALHHHRGRKNLTFVLFIEYLLIAILAVVLLLGVSL